MRLWELSIELTPRVWGISNYKIQDTQYITQNPDITLQLDNFYDATTGVALYFVSVGSSVGGEDILASTPYSSTTINLNSLGLSDYQQYHVNVYGQDLVGLNSTTVSHPFIILGHS
ncbi:MAG: hypothetical protein Ct9H300mP24_7920 [Candidatus Neomarinimicrobiota bacterium]|nr:MAG: hypothetical protein Ct9H300mP24_7920 [Candidatus Neomarinimicrobiota bacterium]